MSDLARLGEEIGRALRELDPDGYARMMSPRGLARQAQWHCRDGWIVGYTTERIEGGGQNHGKFAALAYKPIGRGARSGAASEWKLVYFRTFAKRKAARARAEALYEKHNAPRGE
jgi:hypothetical protein